MNCTLYSSAFFLSLSLSRLCIDFTVVKNSIRFVLLYGLVFTALPEDVSLAILLTTSIYLLF